MSIKSLAESPPLRAGLGLGLGLLLITAAFLGAWHIRAMLLTIFLAGFLAIGLNRVVEMLMRPGRLRPRGMPRMWAIVALVVVFNLVVCGGLALLVPAVAEQVDTFLAAVPSMVDSLLQNDPELAGKLSKLFTPSNVGNVIGGVLGGAVSVAGFVITALTVVLLAMFMLAGYDRVRAGVLRLFPASQRQRAGEVGERILDRVGGYLVGSVGIATIAGTTALIFMLIAGIPYALLLALVVAALDLIPQIGATLGAVIVVAVALTESLTVAVVAAVFFILYQQTENWIIYPRVMKRAVQISNLAAIVVVLIGAALLGVVGVIIAVPGYAAVQILVREFVIPAQDLR